ncbi:hypothetical protein BX616_008125 [Lobosporangium transversale]|nr:hypothetical protein BX616_008125 [Lobosporangium transversale]
MERRKAAAVYGSQSISDIGGSLPSLRGNDSSIKNYIEKLRDVEKDLDSFYSSNNVIKKHRWDAKRARVEEYKKIANSLLKMVGGSIGTKVNEGDKVVIGVGLGKFSSNTRLSSLHESFQSYLPDLLGTSLLA